MASHGNLNSEPQKSEQIITDFFSKTLHIILESRALFVSSRNFSGEQVVSSPSSSSTLSPSIRPRDRLFGLALRDCFPAIDSFDVWRQSGRELLVIDIVLVQRSACDSPTEKKTLSRNSSLKGRFFNCCSAGDEDPSLATEMVAERWVVQYEPRKETGREMRPGRARHEEGKKGGGPRLAKGRGQVASPETQNLYLPSNESPSSACKKMGKRLSILLRSLYLTVRLLPAYRIFKVLNSSSRIYQFSLRYKVLPFAEPFSREEEAEMKLFSFAPVETPCGRLCLCLWYRPSLSDIKFENPIPSSPQLIMDYVGSPSADPLKRFASGSFNSSGKKGTVGLSCNSPCSKVPFARRHSWSNDLNRAVPLLYSNSPPSRASNTSASPSPTDSESRALPSHSAAHQIALRRQLHPDNSPSRSPAHPLDMPKITGFDEYWPSPFSLSPSPSPPIHQYLSRNLIRCESAPLSSSSARICKGTGLPTPNSHERNCNLPPCPSPKRIAIGGPSQGEKRSSIRADELQALEVHSTSPALPTYSSPKPLLCGKEDFGGLYGARVSASSSPRVSVSRSSSRLSFQEESDCESNCPFAIDDELAYPSNSKSVRVVLELGFLEMTSAICHASEPLREGPPQKGKFASDEMRSKLPNSNTKEELAT
ncbi:Autophagy-related protein 13b [Nymphaea thermarum]|nr:Autophagy-related protein 13b [Nymphaea thermarum]